MAENRERIRKENPGLSVTEIAKKGGEEWKSVTDKSKWEKMNEELMEQYKKDKAEYQVCSRNTGRDFTKFNLTKRNYHLIHYIQLEL